MVGPIVQPALFERFGVDQFSRTLWGIIRPIGTRAEPVMLDHVAAKAQGLAGGAKI
jgi:hypothetical protein